MLALVIFFIKIVLNKTTINKVKISKISDNKNINSSLIINNNKINKIKNYVFLNKIDILFKVLIIILIFSNTICYFVNLNKALFDCIDILYNKKIISSSDFLFLSVTLLVLVYIPSIYSSTYRSIEFYLEKYNSTRLYSHTYLLLLLSITNYILYFKIELKYIIIVIIMLMLQYIILGFIDYKYNKIFIRKRLVFKNKTNNDEYMVDILDLLNRNDIHLDNSQLQSMDIETIGDENINITYGKNNS